MRPLFTGDGWLLAWARPDAWFAAHPSLARTVMSPAALKDEVRDKLDRCNVTERVLFPGLDGLSRWLRRHYQPRGRPAPPHA